MNRPVRLASWAACAFALSACTGDGGNSSNPAETSTFKVRLTDKKLEEEGVEAVFVDIARVEVVFEDGNPPVTVATDPGTFDLFELRDGVTTSLGVADLPDGVVGQVRLILRDAWLVIYGSRYDLTVPSGAQTGVKIPFDALLVEDGCSIDALLDFDAEASVLRTGRGDYKLKPVIHLKELITDCDPGPPDPPDPPEPELPPDPVLVAPPLTQTGFPSFYDQVSFLFDGANPIVTDADGAAFDEARISVVHGRVNLRDGSPATGATVSLLGHPEYGRTLTRADGRFDLLVNGGAALTVVVDHDSYITVHRTVSPQWNEHANLDVITLTPVSPATTTVSFAQPIEVAAGDLVTDDDGTRQAKLFFPSSATATLRMPDSSSVSAASLDVHITEFTEGPGGVRAMPADLPTFSDYTYAFEVTVDEAVDAGATRVEFVEPVSFYVDNFLGFEVGTPVPVGRYDRELAAWVPEPSGLVVELLGDDGTGRANVDVDGSGAAADSATLAALGFSDDERARLQSEYSPGTTLWRAQLVQFSSYDLNWGVGCNEALASCLPPLAPPITAHVEEPQVCEVAGSVLLMQSQVAGERIPLAGVPYDLNYRSSRQLGYSASRRISIPVQDSSGVPPGLVDTVLEIDNLGPHDDVLSLGPTPPNTYDILWDGHDRYERALQGKVEAEVRLGYSYPATYQVSSFATAPIGVTATVARGLFTLWQTRSIIIENLDDRARGLGGWSLDVHHRYNPHTRDLYLGDGTSMPAEHLPAVIDTVIGGNSISNLPTTAPKEATSIRLLRPSALVAHPDGGMYVADQNMGCVFRYRDGLVWTVVGDCSRRRQASDPLNFGISGTAFLLQTPIGLAFGPDGDLFVADAGIDRVVRLDAQTGLVEHVAGNGSTMPLLRSPTPAAQAALNVGRIAVDSNGTVYVANTANDCVVTVTPDRVVQPFLGTCRIVQGWGLRPTDGARARSLFYTGEPHDIVVRPDGRVLVALERYDMILEVGTDGRVRRVAGGNGSRDNGLDGIDALDAATGFPIGLADDRRGGFYLTEVQSRQRVWHVSASGTARVVAGSVHGSGGDGGPAIRSTLRIPTDIEVSWDGAVWIVDRDNAKIRRITPRPELDVVPSPDGKEIFTFDREGRHLETVDAETLVGRWTFTYDAEGRLATVTDSDGNMATIERDAAGQPTAFVGPFGHRTALQLDADGYLARVEDPAGQAHSMQYSATGLLETFTNPRNKSTQFRYDAAGYLVGHLDAAGGDATLTRRAVGNGSWEVDFETPEGRTTTYGTDIRSVTDDQTNVFPAGHVAMLSRDRALQTTTVLPDGREIVDRPLPDPRFGVLGSPQRDVKITLPSGTTHSTVITETPVLANADDPLSLQSVTRTTSVNGRQYGSTYDVATRTRIETSPEGRVATTLLDAQGRVVESQQPGRLPVLSIYDPIGNLVERTQGTRSWTYTYDVDNELDTVTDPLGRTTSYDHDAVGRVTREESALGNVTTFGYDGNGNMTSLAPPGRPAHTFSYTDVDLESQYTPPVLPDVSMPETTYAYNLDKDLELESRPDGRDIDWQYDSAGRLSKLVFPAETRDYGYDPGTGQLTGITSTSGEGLAFEYDGDLVTKTTWSGTINASVEKEYDPNFWVVRETINGAHAVDYVYDDDGLLVQAGAMTIQRDPVTGFVTGTTLDNITTQTTYNVYGERETYTAWFLTTMLYYEAHERDDLELRCRRLPSQRTPQHRQRLRRRSSTMPTASPPRASLPLPRWSVAARSAADIVALGRITKTTEIVEGVQKVWEYAYDLDGRLAEAYVDGDLRYSYTYDPNGNRTRFEDPVAGVVITAGYDDQDRLLRYGDTTYTYTEHGETLSETSPLGTTTYDYDVFSNLRGVDLADGTTVDYTIDPSDRRIATFTDGAYTDGFVYRDDLEQIARIDASGAVDQRYVYGTFAHVPDYFETPTRRFAYVSDIRGSVRRTVDTVSGVVAERLDYSPFGIASGATATFGFVGSVTDSATRLSRFGARDYSSATGRWLSKDPEGIQISRLVFGYASGDPINRFDVNGRYDRVLGPEESSLSVGIGVGMCVAAAFIDSDEGLWPWPKKPDLCFLSRSEYRPIIDATVCRYVCGLGIHEVVLPGVRRCRNLILTWI